MVSDSAVEVGPMGAGYYAGGGSWYVGWWYYV